MQNAPSYMFDRVIKTPLKSLAQKYILVTAQNLKFSIKDFFPEEILDRKLHFLCSEFSERWELTLNWVKRNK